MSQSLKMVEIFHKIEQKIDPGISRIEKNFTEFCPKHFDLYTSVYGNLNLQTFGHPLNDINLNKFIDI
jgi:hypothetical protein